MNILIDRKWKKKDYTIGIMYVNGERFCETLEDTDRGLSDTMTESQIKYKKKYGETAIPTGLYKIRMSFSPKFSSKAWGKKYNGMVPEILNVKGFTGVRLHPGNSAGDTLGCILPGKNSVVGKVMQSTEYYYKLLDKHILPAIKRNETIYLSIK